MKVFKLIAGATLVAILAGTLGGCIVDAHPGYWHRYHRVIVVR
jgi:hypothetical protein